MGVLLTLFSHEEQCSVSSDMGMSLRWVARCTICPVDMMMFMFSNLRRMCSHLQGVRRL